MPSSKHRGFSVECTIVGALATVGGVWFANWILGHTVGATLGEAMPYVGHAAGAALAGAALAACARVRPTREPLAAGMVAVAMMAAIFLVPPAPKFCWVPARTGFPWLVAAALMALSGGAAALGAVVGRAITARQARAALLVVQSGITTLGLTVALLSTIAAFMSANVDRSVPAMILVVAFSLVASGFATQRMAPVHAPWLSSGGTPLAVAIAFAVRGFEADWTETVAFASCGLVSWLVGYLGAQLAWRWLGRREEPDRHHHDDLSNIFS